MRASESSPSTFFQALYELRGSAWGRQISQLAAEAVALAHATFEGRDQSLAVLDLGAGDGRDSICFARQGWHVTAVDISENGLNRLAHRARQEQVEGLIHTVNCDFVNLQLDKQYDVIFSNYSLQFLKPGHVNQFFTMLQEKTNPGGIHIHLAIRDENESYVGNLESYHYFRSSALMEIYRHWDIIDYYEGVVPDEHPGQAPHEHQVAIIIARRPIGKSQSQIRQLSGRGKSLLAASFVAALSVLLCTLGYEMRGVGGIAHVWPGAVFQGALGAFFGAWGVLATALAGIITNAIKIQTPVAIFGLLPANLIQSLIPAAFYRYQLGFGGWNSRAFSLWRFAVFAVLVPNAIGGLFGAAVLAQFTTANFAQAYLQWLIANIPIGLTLGVFLFSSVARSLVREGWTIKGWWR